MIASPWRPLPAKHKHMAAAHHVQIAPFVCLSVCQRAWFVYLVLPRSQITMIIITIIIISLKQTPSSLYARGVFTEQSTVKAEAVIAYLWRWSSEEMRNDFDGGV